MKTMLSLIICVGLLGLSSPVTAQYGDDLLPRRGYFGVGLEKADGGARVFSVAPDSTAAAAGISVGTIIEAVDGNEASSPQVVVELISRHKAGESVKIDVRQANERRTINAVLKPVPFEQMTNAAVHYGSVVVSPDVRLRTIVSIPSSSPASSVRFPAVLLIQGGGCGSIDSPFSPTVAQPGLMHTIGSQGFVTMRVEKSGVGDSEGAACDSIGFKDELAGYQAALRSLRSNPSVNPDRIYLLGISLGGVFAPLLAAETKVAGISVFGASSLPPPVYPGRSERFFKEFALVDVAGAWAKAATRVQVLHAEFDVDPYINRAAHETIAAIVNRSAGGSATFKELAGLDHCWSRHPSLEASVDKCGQGEPSTALSDSILEFIRS
jgi:dienelactone hydrolase